MYSIYLIGILFDLFLITYQQSIPFNGLPMYQQNNDVHYAPPSANYESKSISENELENAIRNYFDEQLEKEEGFIPVRDKKSRSGLDAENSPILSHGRKSYDNPLSIEETLCASRMIAESNKMIDSKASTANGAKFLQVEKIISKSQSLKELNEACTALCCANEDGCDTALLSLKLGEEGYRCYQFKCSSHCIFIKHNDYVVLSPKLPDQIQNADPITTGQNQNNDLLNTESMYDSSSNEKLSNVRISFEDDEKSKFSLTTPIVLLIFGVSLILGFFIFLILSTKFMNKKVKWLSNLKSDSKNVDVDEDYLINGMYL